MRIVQVFIYHIKQQSRSMKQPKVDPAVSLLIFKLNSLVSYYDK